MDIPKYEMMFILHPDLGEEGTKKALDDVRRFITEEGGEISSEDLWGHQELAYRIKKQSHGFYAVFNFTFPPEQISEFERNLNIHQGVMRYLMTRIPKNYELKTFADYQKEKAEMESKKAAEEKEKESKKTTRPPRAREIVPERKVVVEREPEVAEEAVVEPKKELAQKPKKVIKLEEVDEKLKNIINDPDISL